VTNISPFQEETASGGKGMKRVLGTFLLFICATVPAYAQRAPAPSGPPNPFWGNTDAVHQGEQLYNQNCTACHGFQGTAGEIGPAILHNLSMPLRGELNDFQIINTIHSGVPGSLMPSFQGKLSDDDILKVGAYLHSLRGTAIDNPTPGDVAHGEEIFWGKGQCGTCHTITGRGSLIGPDLTNIAGTRKTTEIINALTKPQHRVLGDGGVHLEELPVMDTYNAVHIALKDGKSLDGVLLNQDSYSLQIIGSDNEFHHIDRADIRTLTTKPPLMPTDYDKRLTPAEFTDLMAFLTRQGRKAPPPQARRGGGGGEGGG
jgi:cytochrome c oxidase cbb3-type subunit III